MTQPATGAVAEVFMQQNANLRHARCWIAIGAMAGCARWLEFIGCGLYVYTQTNSPTLAALLSSLRMAPYVLAGNLIGGLAARQDRRVMLCGAMAMMSSASLLVTILASGSGVGFAGLAALTVLSGLHWASDLSVRRQLVGISAGRRAIVALAWDSGALSLARVVGVSGGGLLLAVGGIASVLAAISALYVASFCLICLSLTRHPTSRPAGRIEPAAAPSLSPSQNVWAIGGVSVVYNVFCLPLSALMPLIVSKGLLLAPDAIGRVAATEAIGALLASLALSRRPPIRHMWCLYVSAIAAQLAALGILSVHFSEITLYLLLPVTGATTACYTVAQNTLIQQQGRVSRHGRIAGTISATFGSSILGFQLIALLSGALDAPSVFLTTATCGAVALAMIAALAHLHRPRDETAIGAAQTIRAS